jgi:hypothetical protein
MWGLGFALPPYIGPIPSIKNEIPYMGGVSKLPPYMGLLVYFRNIILISGQIILYHPHI